jgi:hypothetical protein
MLLTVPPALALYAPWRAPGQETASYGDRELALADVAATQLQVLKCLVLAFVLFPSPSYLAHISIQLLHNNRHSAQHS